MAVARQRLSMLLEISLHIHLDWLRRFKTKFLLSRQISRLISPVVARDPHIDQNVSEHDGSIWQVRWYGPALLWFGSVEVACFQDQEQGLSVSWAHGLLGTK
jgi:hypothetical protein